MLFSILLSWTVIGVAGGLLMDDLSNARKPVGDCELQGWLENMVWYHGFSVEEIVLATGLSEPEVIQNLKRWNIGTDTRPPLTQDQIQVLPYPGGRHPRIGFLEGAVNPQRETKVSVFAPWDSRSYVVADVPEAIWSNLGLTYLAHTHVETIWSQQGIALEKLEWERREEGYEMTRILPNGISFSTRVIPGTEGLLFEQSLTNGTDTLLTDLRVQNCMMLKSMTGFNQQTNENKVIRKPFVACSNQDSDRWVITAWSHCDRPWANPRCPCMHSDPKFPDCPPQQTREIRGWLSFYEGEAIEVELDRLLQSEVFK